VIPWPANAQIDLLNVQNDFLSVWVDHEVQELNLDFLLGTMELDGRGIRIEHTQPYRTYLTQLPNTVPCEEPDMCGFLDSDLAAYQGKEGEAATRKEGAADTEELPRPSPQARPPEGPALERPPSTAPGIDLLPPPMPPVEPMNQK
jgi:hypothetical protein